MPKSKANFKDKNKKKMSMNQKTYVKSEKPNMSQKNDLNFFHRSNAYIKRKLWIICMEFECANMKKLTTVLK